MVGKQRFDQLSGAYIHTFFMIALFQVTSVINVLSDSLFFVFSSVAKDYELLWMR